MVTPRTFAGSSTSQCVIRGIFRQVEGFLNGFEDTVGEEYHWTSCPTCLAAIVRCMHLFRYTANFRWGGKQCVLLLYQKDGIIVVPPWLWQSGILAKFQCTFMIDPRLDDSLECATSLNTATRAFPELHTTGSWNVYHSMQIAPGFARCVCVPASELAAISA